MKSEQGMYTCEPDPRGFVRVTVAAHTEMGLTDARASLAELARVGGPGRCRALVDIRRIKGLTREAREQFRETTPIVCSQVALLIESPVGRVLGNFFFRTARPDLSMKLFTSEEEAAQWLLGSA